MKMIDNMSDYWNDMIDKLLEVIEINNCYKCKIEFPNRILLEYGQLFKCGNCGWKISWRKGKTIYPNPTDGDSDD